MLYTRSAYQPPCWRWLVTTDDRHKGYACLASPDEEAPPAPGTAQAPADRTHDWMHIAHLFESGSQPQPLGFVPHEFACAGVPGVMRRISVGRIEQQGLYELPLCEERTVPERAYTMSEVTTAPRLLYKVNPHYSDAARQAKLQGTLVMQVLIDERGTAAAFRIIRSLGLGLDENAIEAVRRWRFRPAFRGETPVRMWVPVEVNYRLF